MIKTIFTFLFLLLTTSSFASTVVLDWDASTDVNLAGYKVYQQSDVATLPFTQVQTVLKGTSTVTINNLDSTKAYFFAVTAYNTSGQESVYSNIATVYAFPKAPENVRAISIVISP